MKIDILRTLIEHFCLFSLSTFQSKGHSQKLFHLENIQTDVTVNSDLDKRIQKSCIREGRVGIMESNKFLPPLLNQDSKPNGKTKFQDFQE